MDNHQPPGDPLASDSPDPIISAIPASDTRETAEIDNSSREELEVLPEDRQPDLYPDWDDFDLMKSFDMIFQLHQRSEEIRSHLDKIDRILLRSRTLTGLTRQVIRTLERDLDLIAVRILYRENHPIARFLTWDRPEGAGIIADGLSSNERFFDSEVFVLDNPSGDLGKGLFGESAHLIASAVLAGLCADGEELGILCLGSDDPARYCGGMNTDLIVSLAEKISLGIRNAWDHEKMAYDALSGRVPGILSEVFFREFVQREFNRAWRYNNPFCLMAISWKVEPSATFRSIDELAALVLRNVRASDLCAQGDGMALWMLLPETDISGANAVAERLISEARDRFCGEVGLHIGVTEFSRGVPVANRLVQQTRIALEEAQEDPSDRIVIKIIPPPPIFPAPDKPPSHEEG